MKNFFVLIFSIVSYGFNAQDHYVGLKGALGIANVTEVAIENKSILGSSYGITYEYFNTSRMIISAELLISNKGFRNELFEETLYGDPIRILSIDNRFQYLTVPLSLVTLSRKDPIYL